MKALSAIPLPIRIGLGFVLPLLLVQVLAPYATLLVWCAALLWLLTAVSLFYRHGLLSGLARVPVLSGLLDGLTGGRPRAATAGSGPSRPTVAEDAVGGALSEEARNRLYADGRTRLASLVGVDDALDAIEHRLVDVARAAAGAGDKGFGSKAPALVALLSGPRGVGKSEAARAISEIYAGLGSLETAKIVRLREQDVKNAYGAGGDAARARAEEAVGGTLLLDDADWLLSDPAGADAGLSILDVATEHHQRMLVLVVLSARGERALRADADHARWLGKLTVRTVSFPALSDDALLEILARQLDHLDAELDPAALPAARSLLRDARARAQDAFDNAVACRRVAEVLVEIAMGRADPDGGPGRWIVTRDDLRIAAETL